MVRCLRLNGFLVLTGINGYCLSTLHPHGELMRLKADAYDRMNPDAEEFLARMESYSSIGYDIPAYGLSTAEAALILELSQKEASNCDNVNSATPLPKITENRHELEQALHHLRGMAEDFEASGREGPAVHAKQLRIILETFNREVSEELTFRQERDTLAAEVERLRAALGEIEDINSAFTSENERTVSYRDYELRAIARRALAAKGE